MVYSIAESTNDPLICAIDIKSALLSPAAENSFPRRNQSR